MAEPIARTPARRRITVVGLGYIGLPTAAVLASRGLEVVGVDVNEAAVETVNRGQVHIVEPDLDILVRGAVSTGNLVARTLPEPADVFLIAVPTPFGEGHRPDLSYVEAAAHSIAPVLRSGNLVILESTCPVGTTEHLCEWLASARPDLSMPHLAGESSAVRVAYCPERVLPGKVISELVNNDRVVGGITPACANAAVALYKTFVLGECVLTDARTAEMCKLSENAFRDLNIAFANELSLICDKLEIDVWELIRLANRHPRVNILQPGPGVGGHCIAVDPWFIVSAAPEESRLIRTAREVNDHKPEWVAAKVLAAAERAAGAPIACFGLSFKANIDDLRESPAVEVVRAIALRAKSRVLVVEPFVEALPEALRGLKNIALVPAAAALAEAEILVALVDHDQFRSIDPKVLEGKTVIDARGMWRSKRPGRRRAADAPPKLSRRR
jgi:UDP-N-acetyl-D-mannosaminuronic acid dehydrogenase